MQQSSEQLNFGVKSWTQKYTSHRHSGDYVSHYLEAFVSEVCCSVVEPKLVPSDPAPKLINTFGVQKSLSLWSCLQPPSFHHGWRSTQSYCCLCHFSFFLAPTLPFCPKATSQFAWNCPRSVIFCAVVSLLLFNILVLGVLSKESSIILQGTNCNLAEQ